MSRDRVRPEQHEKVLPELIFAEQDKGRNDDEEGAEVVRRADADVKIRPPIHRPDEFFEKVLQEVYEHYGEKHIFFGALRALPQQKVHADRECDHKDRIEKIGKIAVLHDHMDTLSLIFRLTYVQALLCKSHMK